MDAGGSLGAVAGIRPSVAREWVDRGRRERGRKWPQYDIGGRGGAELVGSGRAVGVGADNADAQTPERLIAAARDAFGRLDGALISVDGPPTGTSDTIDDQRWRDAFESGFLGATRLSRAVAAELGDGGVIGFALSTSVYEPIPGLAISNALRPGLAWPAMPRLSRTNWAPGAFA